MPKLTSDDVWFIKLEWSIAALTWVLYYTIGTDTYTYGLSHSRTNCLSTPVNSNSNCNVL